MNVPRGSAALLMGALISLWALPVYAAPTPVSISIESDISITSANAEIREGTAQEVVVKVFAPRRHARSRFLWQLCEFPYSGPSTYECGMDSRAMKKNPGAWIAKAFLDDELSARRRFEI